MQVKIFRARNIDIDFEKKVNDWLSAQTNIEIHHTQTSLAQAVYSEDESRETLILTIWYRHF